MLLYDLFCCIYICYPLIKIPKILSKYQNPVYFIINKAAKYVFEENYLKSVTINLSQSHIT